MTMVINDNLGYNERVNPALRQQPGSGNNLLRRSMQMHYTIPLARNLVALVDEEDYPLVSQYKWVLHATKNHKLFYARAVPYLNGKQIEIALHRLIMGFPEGKFIDHKNGNGLDNRRSNLRICTQAENVRNARLYNTNKSGYRGVISHKGSWRASIGFNGRCIYLGTFNSAIEAAKKYDEEAKKLHGEFAALNFPQGEVHP